MTHANDKTCLFDQGVERLQEELDFIQWRGAIVVDQHDESDAALAEDLPHEIESLLAGRPVQVNVPIAVEIDPAVIHRDGGGQLEPGSLIGGLRIRSDRVDIGK
ncbi:hypothetical protein SDC9_189726 [bioreactor metagenome]|uniref:Uncharacterized protein n=1 Tax=bioreactor metagenome TaxID=1076179 RepID=A0A645HTI7_9ZZZZ